MSSPCCVDPGAKQVHETQGEYTSIDGINTYQTGNGKSAVLVCTDIFGAAFINARQIADRIAANTNTTVFVPDYFNGDPMDPDASNLWDLLPAWLGKHPTSEACRTAEKLFHSIKDNFQSIQLIGFCYGAKVVVHFLSNDELSAGIKAAVVAHPSFLVQDEAEQIKRPMLFLCAENDSLFEKDLRAKFQSVLTANGLGTFLEYPGTTHGFVVRPDGSEKVEQEREKALQAAFDYFNKHR